MKILMITPYVPYPPSSGGQIRTYNLLKYLSKNHQITLVCLYKNDQEKQYFSQLKKYCHQIYFCQRSSHPWSLNNIIKTIFSLKPFLIIRNFSHQAKNTINNLIKNNYYDVIHGETFYVMPHIPNTKTPIVLVEQTIEYNVYRHFVNSLPFIYRLLIYFDIDIIKLKFWEKYYWKKANLIITVSSKDKEVIKKDVSSLKIDIVPNCAGDEMILKKIKEKNFDKKINILFQGNFYWLQNIEAANFIIKKIFPIIKELPQVNLIIAGQNIKKLSYKKNFSNIKIIDINEKNFSLVKKLYQNSHLFVAPLFGPGGTRLKILAAMAAGLPVISTKIGIEGLDLKDNKEVLIAETPNEFIEKIKQIINNKNLYQKIRNNAYQLIKKKYTWKESAKKLASIYKKIKEDVKI